jgi:hypothetical protein
MGDTYVVACCVIVGMIGIVGALWLLGLLVMEAIDIWFKVFKLKGLLCEFIDWRAAEERRKASERRLSRTQNNQ